MSDDGFISFVFYELRTISGVDETRTYTVTVRNGFLKAVDNETPKENMSPEDKKFERKIHCWTSNQTYSEMSYNLNLAQYTEVCDNDPGFYQYCGTAPLGAMAPIQAFGINDTLCGSYICTNKKFPVLGALSPVTHDSGLYPLKRFQCSGNYDICDNIEAEKLRTKNCGSEKWFHCEISGVTVPMANKCDGVNDCLATEDEMAEDCQHDYGITCESSKDIAQGAKIWRSPLDTCKMDEESSICIDEIDLYNKSEACSPSVQVGSCPRRKGGELIPLFPAQMCGAYSYYNPEDPGKDSRLAERVCYDGRDQINCTNRDIVFTCNHTLTNYTISLTDVVLCKDLGLCTDNIPDLCEEPEASCKVHRHFMCDGEDNCDNGQDEVHCEELQTEETCLRRVRKRPGDGQEPVKMYILKSWVKDGVVDCENGEDENVDNWKVCEYVLKGDRKVSDKSLYKNANSTCNAAFICNPDEPDEEDVVLIDPNDMCDGRQKKGCPIESSLCLLSRDKEVKVEVFSPNRLQKYLYPCIPGLMNEGNHSQVTCQNYILEDSYGTQPIEISGPADRLYDCANLFGESYVYSSCLNLCSDESVVCPIRKVNYLTSCPDMPNRTLTLTKKGDLTFVEPIEDGKFINKEMFPCENGRCVLYSQTCDLINDCGDNSDEKYCNNHFSCDNATHEIIKKSQFCDGIIHCSNEYDECHEDCPQGNNKTILQSTVLRVFGWLIGIPAILMNGFMMLRNLIGMLKGEHSTAVSLSISALVTLIALGDFFVGLYLVCISIENVARSEGFCKEERNWLTSSSCEFYGVISTFGSELSVFAMTSLSVYRAFVMRRLNTGQRPQAKFKLLLGLGCLVLTALAFLIAIIPIEPHLHEAYFNNGYFIENAAFFLSPKKSGEFWPLLRKYFGANEIDNIVNSSTSVKRKVEEMFSKSSDADGKQLDFKILGFYGSSGSCTFKFFVDEEDPQKHYTWAVLMINLASLFIISAGYLSVHLLTQNSANKVGITNRFGPLQRKITFIIFTDFLCWLPFIVVCVIYYIDKNIINEKDLYPAFATIVLPINSIINPLLYDNVLATLPSYFWQKLTHYARVILPQSCTNWSGLRRKFTNNGEFRDHSKKTVLSLDQFGNNNLQISRNDINNSTSRVSQVTAC